MANFTPLLLIATSGLVKGFGVGVSKDLTSATTDFSTSGISGSVQSICNNDNISPGIKDSLAQLPGFMTGLPPSGLLLPSGFSNTDLIGEVTGSANDIAGGGVAKFASYMGQSSSYAASTFGFQGALAQARGMKFDDLGFTFTNFQDMMSGGVTSQFDSDTKYLMASEITNLGTMFDVGDLFNLDDPGTLCMNLISQGLGAQGGLVSRLEDQGLDILDLSGTTPALILEIMANVTGSDLAEVIDLTAFQPYSLDEIETLADVFDVNKVFSPEFASKIGSMSTLANKLGNIGGNFNSFAELGDFYGGIETDSYGSLDSLDTLVPDDILDLGGAMGSGSGQFGNPTTNDIIGSAAGTGYTDNIASCVAAQQDLIANDDTVRNLHDYLQNNPVPDAATLNGLIESINSKPQLQEIIKTTESQYNQVGDKIVAERTNQKIVGMEFGANISLGNMQGVMSLGQQVPGFAIDPMNLGLGTQIANMATPDIYGDALQASLQESRNLNRMQAFGISPGTKMDPMAYAKQLSSMQG